MNDECNPAAQFDTCNLSNLYSPAASIMYCAMLSCSVVFSLCITHCIKHSVTFIDKLMIHGLKLTDSPFQNGIIRKA